MSQVTDELLAELKRPNSELYQVLSKMMSNAVKANVKAGVMAALGEADVLRTDTFQAQIVGPLDQWLRDRVFEGAGEAIKHSKEAADAG